MNLLEAIEAEGLKALGGFLPQLGDDVPDVSASAPAAYLLLVGNVGPPMFEAFERVRDPRHDKLDEWCEDVLGAIAARAGARAVYPWERPYLPFQRWAQRCGAGQPSMLGMNIHPDYGLWYGFRGALLFAKPPGIQLNSSCTEHPCEACPDKPCLQACPVGAFTGDSANPYAVGTCVKYLQSDNGKTCLEQGCKARMACPVGIKHAYSPIQIQFHLAAFFRARQSGS